MSQPVTHQPGPIVKAPVLKECHQCHQLFEKVQKCAYCKIANYCGRDCQALAWPTHKQACQLKQFGDQLEPFFNSITLTKKLFLIGKQKIGITYNPEGPIVLGSMTMGSPVVFSSTKLSQEIVDLITSKSPKGTFSVMSCPIFNGQPILKALDFE